MGTRSVGVATVLAVGLLATLQSPANAETIPPTITFADRTAPNAAGWNNTDVTVNWDCTDEVDGSGVVSPTVSVTLITEAADQSATGTCTDNDGNSASDTQTGINIDKTGPAVTGTMSRAPDHPSGYYTSPVTISFSGTDDTSGIASCSADYDYSFPDSASAFALGTCTDAAGNTTLTAKGFKYDSEAPGATIDSNAMIGFPSEFGGQFNTAPAGAPITGAASDRGSGVSKVFVEFCWNPCGSQGPLSSPKGLREATLANPGGTSTTWSVPTEGLVPGGYIVKAWALDGVDRLSAPSRAQGYAITGP